MESFWKDLIWRQFGGAIDMLENAIRASPDDLWGDRSARPEYWYTAFHTLFWLDLYLSDSPEEFVPPEPLTLDELDPAGLLPDRVYTKDEILTYLDHCPTTCRTTIAGLTEETIRRPYTYGSGNLTFGELLLYNMRHVQHHAAQLNLILRQRIDSAPGWVRRANEGLPEE